MRMEPSPLETASLIKLLQDCQILSEKYKWLADSFVLDFFTQDIWNKNIPESWRTALSSASPKDFANLLDYKSELKGHVWPLEVLALRSSVRRLGVPREAISKSFLNKVVQVDEDDVVCQVVDDEECQVDEDDVVCQVVDDEECQVVDDDECFQEEEWLDFRQELSLAAGQHKNLEHVFRKHVKPKKQHEIARLCDVIRTFAKKQNVNHLIDIGSGVGHLSRLLSFGHGFNVICVDAQTDLSHTASKFDADLIKASKSGHKLKPRHVTLWIESDTSAHTFIETIFPESDVPDFGIIGLHTCGDLGPTLLRLFSECSNAKFLISVGCCYMRLDKNFPLNCDLFSEASNPVLSYSSKELACHAIEAYGERLLDDRELSKLKVHCNRAVLEYLIVSQWPEKAHLPLKAVAHSHTLTFEDYVTRATQNLGIQFDVSTLKSDGVRDKLERWREVLGFYILRLLIAPVVEHLLLLDRLIKLKRSGFQSWILPVFDPRLSPRNHVLLARKK